MNALDDNSGNSQMVEAGIETQQELDYWLKPCPPTGDGDTRHDG